MEKSERIEKTFAGTSPHSQDKKEAIKAGHEFESFLLTYMIKKMRDTVMQSDLLGNRKAENIYRSMLDEQIAHELSQRGGLGLADMISRQLERQTGARHASPLKVESSLQGVGHLNQDLGLTVSAQISSGYGWRRDPFTGERKWHDGIDIALPAGSPVRAAGNGKVIFSGEIRGYGKVVILRHAGGVETVYAHNQENECREGEYVRKGEILGRVGCTGRATGPHLHFEIRKAGKAVNPSRYIHSRMAVI
ncbi:MAG: peptidoglycan DD-metalloendopeptidase family protein [Deltaproteobacteria bacterium]|nr:peptidoglycan DD-metalloendopeptidase family protein [Deltaproteobacteria bacterium]